MNIPAPVAIVARVLIALMFVVSGLMKFGDLAGTAGFIASKGLPLPDVLAFLAAALELFGGIAVIIGFQARIGALALAVFTLVATVLFHNYWAMPADQQLVQQLMFMKNLSVAGGLLMLSVLGAGPASLDARRTAA